MLQNVGALLTLFAALTALSLFRVRRRGGAGRRPTTMALAAAAVYGVSAAWMLYFGFRSSTRLLAWVIAIAAVAVAFYAWTASARARAKA